MAHRVHKPQCLSGSCSGRLGCLCAHVVLRPSNTTRWHAQPLSCPPHPTDQVADVIEQIDMQYMLNPRARPSKSSIKLPRSPTVQPHSAPSSPRAGVDGQSYALKHSISLPSPHARHTTTPTAPSQQSHQRTQRPMTALGTSHTADSARSFTSRASETPQQQNRSAASGGFTAGDGTAAPVGGTCNESFAVALLAHKRAALGLNASGARRVMSAPYARHVEGQQIKYSHSRLPIPTLRPPPSNLSLYPRPASAATGDATHTTKANAISRPRAPSPVNGTSAKSLDFVSVSPISSGSGMHRPCSAQPQVRTVARAPTDMLQTRMASALSRYVQCK